MAIDLATKYAPYTDELFAAESKLPLLTNQDFDWNGAHSVKIYTVTTAKMNDYDRTGATLGVDGKWSRYGAVEGLNATTQEMTLTKDRSFTFAIDSLDENETLQQLEGASALARQLREVVVPEVDSHVYGMMCTGAGTKPTAAALTAENIYSEILKGSEALDDAEAPEVGRVLLLTPASYTLLKKSPDVIMETDIGADMRMHGVIGMIDGLSVMKVPANRLPKDFGFMIAHRCATVAPVKLEEFCVHQNPPGISGALVEGRVCYDAFVMTNKAKAIYYQAVPIA